MQTGKMINRISNRLRRRSRAIQESLGITGAQGNILDYIIVESGSHSVYQKEIEEEFGLRPSTATEALKNLEKKGLIRREAEKQDARYKKIVFTEKAETIREALRTEIEESEQLLLKGISASEQKEFLRITEQMLKNLDAAGKEGRKMKIKIRKAVPDDLDAVSKIYENIHTEEEKGQVTIGWVRGVYPERITAKEALNRDDLFVEELDGKIVGTAILNQIQVDVYKNVAWEYDVPDDQVMVMHTLVIDPQTKGRGLGQAFAEFYEQYALQQGCAYLRIDTNARNLNARKFYKKLHYKEIATVPCVFNGIDGVNLVMLEKKLALTS